MQWPFLRAKGPRVQSLGSYGPVHLSFRTQGPRRLGSRNVWGFWRFGFWDLGGSDGFRVVSSELLETMVRHVGFRASGVYSTILINSYSIRRYPIIVVTIIIFKILTVYSDAHVAASGRVWAVVVWSWPFFKQIYSTTSDLGGCASAYVYRSFAKLR